MHPLNVVFWVFFTAVAAFIGWSFIRMFVEMLSDRRHMRETQRPARSGNTPILGGATGGGQSVGESATSIGGSDYGHSITIGDLGSDASNGGDSGGGDSGGSDSGSGDFSGGGGDYGGGGSSGGW